MAFFYLVQYPRPPFRVTDKGRVTIGRAETNTIVLDEPRVSRLHALIEWRDRNKRFILLDLGSSNGTFLNGAKIAPSEEMPLSDRDKVRIASAVFTARFVEDPLVVQEEFHALSRQSHGHITEIIPKKQIQRPPRPPSLSGVLEHLCPLELFQVLESGQKTGMLMVRAEQGEGMFGIIDGRIVTACFNRLKGEQAVYEILKCRRGHFSFVQKTDIAVKEQIAVPTTALLLEGCRRMDEGWKGRGEG
jgi:hypothetical protein